MKRCAIYLRVSTQEQVDKGYSLEAQEEKLLAFAKASGYKVVKVYKEAGVSGAKSSRPELDKLKENIENIDIVLVYKLDRLSRSIKDTMILIEDIFDPNNVSLVSLTENLDTSSAIGRATIGIISTMAQLERDTITERMALGKTQSVKNGNYINNTPFGFVKTDKKLIKDENVKEIVDYIFKRLAEDVSIVQVSKELRDNFKNFGYSERWYFYTIARMLKTDVYCGHTTLMKVTVLNTHEAYITDEEFKKIKELVRRRTTSRALSPNKKNYVALFRGLIKCQNCGKRFATQRKAKLYNSYHCINCKRFTDFPALHAAEHAIEQALVHYLNTPKVKINKSDEFKQIVKPDFKTELEKLDKKYEKIKKAWFDDLINDDDLEKFVKDIEKQRKRLIRERDRDKKNKEVQLKRKDIRQVYMTFKRAYYKLDYETKHKLLNEIIDYIEIDIVKRATTRVPNDVTIKNIVFKYD